MSARLNRRNRPLPCPAPPACSTGLIKMYPKQHSTGQKKPLLFAHLAAMRKALGTIASPHVRATLWLQLIVGHEGMLRGGELMALEWRDVEFFNALDGRAAGLDACVGVRLTIRAAKTGDGQPVEQHVLLAKRQDEFDSIGLLWAGYQRTGSATPTAPIFTETPGGAAVKKDVFIARMRALLIASGAGDPKCFAGHSLRAGGATDAFDSGVPIDAVIAQGRWRSDSWKRYRRDTLSMVRLLAVTGPSPAYGVMPGPSGTGPGGPAPQAVVPAVAGEKRQRVVASQRPQVALPPRPVVPVRVGASVTVLGAGSPFVGTVKDCFTREGEAWHTIEFLGSADEQRPASDLVVMAGRRGPQPVERFVAGAR